jgi:hypothetical protein
MAEVFWPDETSPGSGGNPCANLPAGSPAYVSCQIAYGADSFPTDLPDAPPATPAKSGPEELAVMEATAEQAHAEYYAVGGTGYGTTPGGPDVYYFDYGQSQPTTYEQGTFFGTDLPDKQNILNYAVLAIGAYALLKR